MSTPEDKSRGQDAVEHEAKQIPDLEVTDREAAEQVRGGALIAGTGQEEVAEEVLGKDQIPAAQVPKFSAGSALKAAVKGG